MKQQKKQKSRTIAVRAKILFAPKKSLCRRLVHVSIVLWTNLREEDGEQGVQDGNTRYSLNSFLPSWNPKVVVGENGQEVGVNAEDDG